MLLHTRATFKRALCLCVCVCCSLSRHFHPVCFSENGERRERRMKEGRKKRERRRGHSSLSPMLLALRLCTGGGRTGGTEGGK